MRISFLAQRWSPILTSLSRFSSRHYFLSIAISIPFLFSHLPQRASIRARCNAVSDLTLSSYVSPILYPRHFSTPYRPAHTLFLLSEGHWNRIKLYAGLSMPPFPPSAMKGGIRHDGSIRSEKWGDLIWTRTKFPWPLIKRSNRSTSETMRKGFANLPGGDDYDGGDR